MKSRRNPILGLFLASLVVASAGGLSVQYLKTRRLNQNLVRLRDEANQWSDSVRSTMAGNDESVAGALVMAQRALERQRLQWLHPMEDSSPEPVPEGEIDLLLACARFEEKVAREARSAGVELPKDDELGIRELGMAAKEEQPAADVRARLRLSEEVLTALWSARPRRLDAMRWAQRSAVAGAAAPRTFVWTPPAPASATAPEGVDSVVCRVDFQGSSECLGRLLDAVSRSSLLLVVRRVNAETIATNAAVFRVVVEWIRPSKATAAARTQS